MWASCEGTIQTENARRAAQEDTYYEHSGAENKQSAEVRKVENLEQVEE